MVKCNVCGKKEATVKIVKVINGEQTVTHLCEECAKSHQDLNFSPVSFNLSSLLTDFFGAESKNSMPKIYNSSALSCSKCGLTWNGFKSRSRLGCDECYNAFRKQLLPLIRRLHGTVEHQGQIPHSKKSLIQKSKSLKRMRMKLQEAIVEERFEDAAKIRDQIKQIETGLEVEKNE